MSVAEEFAGFHSAIFPIDHHVGPLRLVSPWHEDIAAWPGVVRSPVVVPATTPPFDRRAAASALHEVICQWRAVARELEEIPAASLDRAALEAQEGALRSIHNRLFAELRVAEEQGADGDSPDWDTGSLPARLAWGG